jgi:hypothetical protein
MWVNASDNLPFVEELFKLETADDSTKVLNVTRYVLDAHSYLVRVARYLNPDTGEVEPRIKLRRNSVTGELTPDCYVDGTQKVYVCIDRVVTSAPEWA